MPGGRARVSPGARASCALTRGGAVEHAAGARSRQAARADIARSFAERALKEEPLTLTLAERAGRDRLYSSFFARYYNKKERSKVRAPPEAAPAPAPLPAPRRARSRRAALCLRARTLLHTAFSAFESYNNTEHTAGAGRRPGATCRPLAAAR
ncbi:hypothetical protein EVAR_14660_1 [Eumeta japonica]|uniref:Uncharacterized protein n=1 Tax=Eumeta variegata TaxID=151549 RepID=A0A4C1U274_EUMVA|nr:hypothetical protein EVAR_14660_1 [Eumeta japonica]